MPHFDIVKTCEPSNSFRVSKIQADFDVKQEHAQEHFVGDIIFPDEWNIGCIVGGSGTGKTTIARELFQDTGGGYIYTAQSVVDDMPAVSVNEIPLSLMRCMILTLCRGRKSLSGSGMRMSPMNLAEANL